MGPLIYTLVSDSAEVAQSPADHLPDAAGGERNRD